MTLDRNFAERETRYKTQLTSPIFISAVSNIIGRKETYLTFRGDLLDASSSGLSVAISYYDMRELKRLTDDWIMRLLLSLPERSIEIEAVPIRFQRLNETMTSKIIAGCLITNMNGIDRLLFTNFLSECQILKNKS